MSFDRKDFLRGRLTHVREDLKWCLDRITDADLPWSPSPDMRTIGGQLAEIIGTENQIMGLVKGDTRDFGGVYDRLAALASLEDLLAEMASQRRETLDWIESASPEELDRLIPINPAWFEAGGQTEIPAEEAIKAVAMHEWYHTGQLISYLWQRGHNPYAEVG